MKEKFFYVYILASKSRRLYTGMRNSLLNRVQQHKDGAVEGFTRKYNINRLVHFEVFQYVNNCINREKQIKSWTRAKRVALIQSKNPTWEDLSVDLLGRGEQQIPRCARDDNSNVSSGRAEAGPSQLQDLVPTEPSFLSRPECLGSIGDRKRQERAGAQVKLPKAGAN